jgi:hypothetical protein
MDALCLTLEVMAGGYHEHTAIKAQGLANTLGIAVRYTFNGIECCHLPGGSSEDVNAAFLAARKRHTSPEGT